MSHPLAMVANVTSSPYRQITESQRAFAVDAGTVLDSRGWAVDYRDNLLAPLHPASLKDFIACGEITDDGLGGRISAPHSSTAFAVNTFDWRRGRDLSPIAEVLGVDIDRIVGFERKRAFGLDRPAQPDIEFIGRNDSAVAVEVKLREPYGSVSNPFADKYFKTDELWEGLPTLHNLARRIRDTDKMFSTLHAAQLIKHAIGLRHRYGDNFTLVYYWHYLPSKTGDTHRTEIAQFADIAGGDITFVAVTLEEMLGRFAVDEESKPWFDYMTNRYLNSARPPQP
jgi:hypothetical protein